MLKLGRYQPQKIQSSHLNPVHFSITDRVESISSLGSRRKRHLVGLFSTEFFLLSCVLPIEAKTGVAGFHLYRLHGFTHLMATKPARMTHVLWLKHFVPRLNKSVRFVVGHFFRAHRCLWLFKLSLELNVFQRVFAVHVVWGRHYKSL